VYFTVTCDGVPIGATELEGWGMRAGVLARLPAFTAFGLHVPARRLGIAFMAVSWSRVPAAAASRAWQAASGRMEELEERLGLLDASGSAVPSPKIALVDLPRRSRMQGTYILVDLGEAGAARGALRRSPPAGDGAESRPAA
jgi:hypothetical protein